MSKIDKTQVRTALLHGLPPQLIAERLGCSRRHIRRIRKDEGLEDFTPVINIQWGRGGANGEHMDWAWWKQKEGKSYRQIAYRYCVSHEHVRQTLNELNAQHIKKENV